jgi:hypothetical protein
MISLKSELNSYASMLQLRCPACNSTDADFLEHISKAAQVEYFRCRYCGHVWNTPKHDPEGKLVTSHRYGGKKITIYVTRTGQKYHRDGCRYVARSRIPMSLKEATKRFGPCSFALAAEVAGKTTTTERPDRNRYPDERRNCASNHSEVRGGTRS